MGEQLGCSRRCNGVSNVRWGLVRDVAVVIVGAVEGVGAMVEHLLGIVVQMGGSLNAQVAEHSVGFPAAQEHDGVLVDTSTEQGGGTTGAQRTSADFLGVDTGDITGGSSGTSKNVGDHRGLDMEPGALRGVIVVVRVERSVRKGFGFAEVQS